jgi:hypothetical protein
VTKVDFNTFNAKLASYFKEAGAHVYVLYSHDGVDCYQVKLRGREQCRLLKTSDVTALASAAQLDAWYVLKQRLGLPLHTICVDGVPALIEDKEGVVAVPLSRDTNILTEAAAGSARATIRAVNSYPELVGLLPDSSRVRFLIGYGPHSKIPYQETYPVELVRTVAERLSEPAE